jgi:anti-anti-sigma factor
MISVEQRDSVNIVSPRGELEMTTTGELFSVIKRAGEHDRPVVVSMSECRYCDSTGLSVFIRAKKALGRRFAICVPADAPVRRIFEVTNMLQHLSVFERLEDAIRSVLPELREESA